MYSFRDIPSDMKEYITIYLLSTTALFTVVNPIGVLTVFTSFTSIMDPPQVKQFAKRIALISMITLLAFAIAGKIIFSFFNISLEALRIVGGVLFFIVGYDMLQAKVARTKSVTPKEIDEINEMAITPFAIPMICGPGAITVAMVQYQDAHDTFNKVIILFSILTVMLLTYLLLAHSDRVAKLLGRSGRKVFSRLMGLIMMMIAVEFFFSGLKSYVTLLFNP